MLLHEHHTFICHTIEVRRVVFNLTFWQTVKVHGQHIIGNEKDDIRTVFIGRDLLVFITYSKQS